MKPTFKNERSTLTKCKKTTGDDKKRRKKMSRNFNAGSRDMSKAGAILAKQSTQSFSSAATLASRFDQFVDFAKEQGIKYLEGVTKDTVLAYAETLKNSDLSASTQQNYLSAVNVVMAQGRGDDDVRVTGSEAGLEQRSGVAQEYKGNVERGELTERTQAIVELARDFGLRFEEASKMDAKGALESASKGFIVVDRGTKGGHPREIPITSEKQLQTLKTASEVQGSDKSMIASDKSYAEHQREAYKETSHFHSERHAYACDRYSQIMQEKLNITLSAPVLSDKAEGQPWRDYIAEKAAEQGVNITPELAREFDREARLELSTELGHHREDVVSAYIGGQR
jgi:hypothetical protein